MPVTSSHSSSSDVPGSVVIVGAGHGGAQVAASLRQAGFAGSITLIHGEPGLPYQRPPLSKAYLLGEMEPDRLLLRQEHWYAKQAVELIGDRAARIDRERRQVHLDGGRVVDYDHLVLATGSRNRELSVPGHHLDGVHGMRTREDADALSGRIGPEAQVAVVGAGFIGLEFAAVAAARGAKVHVLEMADRAMARAVGEQTAQFVQDAHAGWGVTLDFGASVVGLEGERTVTGVVTGDERVIAADLVVCGIGVVPETALATDAELAIENGIRVDGRLLTDDAAISAIGDAVSFPSVHADGRRVRLESVQNAADQGRYVAARLTGGAHHAADYDSLPWFWSDQGDLKIQIAGLAESTDATAVLPGRGERELTALRFRDGRLVAAETVNRAGDHMLARRILAEPTVPTLEQATAPGFELKQWLEEHSLAASGR